jgi:hypothetical protein
VRLAVPLDPRLLERGGEAAPRASREGDPVDDDVGLARGAHRLRRAKLLERAHLAADQQPAEPVSEEPRTHADEGLGVGHPDREGQDHRRPGMLVHQRLRGRVRVAADGLHPVVGAEGERLAGEERREVGLEIGQVATVEREL